ncbi:MAG: lycopene cyclase family protein, partial [Pelagibacteraceae bacterium]
MTYDIAIIGAGCAGLSLAYQLSKVKNLNKKIIILDNKSEFKKDRTWSFWKTNHHDFEDCLEKQWFKFNIKYNEQFKSFNNFKYPYQTIDSLKFYKKIQNNLKDNFYIKLDTNISEIKKTSKFYQIETNNGNIETKLVFDSRVPKLEQGNL